MSVCARVKIPVPPSATSCPLYELSCGVRLGFLVVSPFRIACVVLHVERGRSSKRVWRSPLIVYNLFMILLLERKARRRPRLAFFLRRTHAY
jgi:hypothetical protein